MCECSTHLYICRERALKRRAILCLVLCNLVFSWHSNSFVKHSYIVVVCWVDFYLELEEPPEDFCTLTGFPG